MDKTSEIYNFYLKARGDLGIIKGESMYPALKEGLKIKVEQTDENDIKVGDIVVFGKDHFVCHRIIGKFKFFGQTYFLHKGDSSVVGGIFESKDLVGKVVEAFEEDRRLDREKWRGRYFNDNKVKGYIYLLLYLLKRFIWREKTNRLSRFIYRYYWKFLT